MEAWWCPRGAAAAAATPLAPLRLELAHGCPVALAYRSDSRLLCVGTTTGAVLVAKVKGTGPTPAIRLLAEARRPCPTAESLLS